MSRLLILPPLLFLVACGGVPTAEIELEPLLIQPGDLPAGMVGGQIQDRAVNVPRDALEPVKAITQELSVSGARGDSVSVSLYDTQEIAATAFDVIKESREGITLTDKPVGEQRAIFLRGSRSDVVSLRCRAVVVIRMGHEASGLRDASRIYAERLDKRLEPVVC